MELWIRSQNKLILTKGNELVIQTPASGSFSERYYITNYNTDTGTRLGEYTTKERALEVLDEIQRHITNSLCFKENQINKWSQVSSKENYSIDIPYYKSDVYQMPKE